MSSLWQGVSASPKPIIFPGNSGTEFDTLVPLGFSVFGRSKRYTLYQA